MPPPWERYQAAATPKGPWTRYQEAAPEPEGPWTRYQAGYESQAVMAEVEAEAAVPPPESFQGGSSGSQTPLGGENPAGLYRYPVTFPPGSFPSSEMVGAEDPAVMEEVLAGLEAAAAEGSIRPGELSLLQRLRRSAPARALLGRTLEERAGGLESAAPHAAPVDIARKMVEFTTLPPAVQETISELTEHAVRGQPAPVAGVVKGVVGTAAGLPVSLPVAGRGASGAFAADIASHVPELKEEFDKAVAEGDSERAWQLGTELGLTAGFAGVAAKHAAKPGPRPPAVELARELDRSVPQVEARAAAPKVREVEAGPWERYQGREPLTERGRSANVAAESPPAETITGPRKGDERTGSGMPAEREERPRAATVSRSDFQRPWDIIDEIEGAVGKIDPSLIREAAPDWRPVGAARRIFRRGGSAADAALNALTYEGNKLGLTIDMGLDALGVAINAAARARQDYRRQNASGNRDAELGGKQLEQFEKRVLYGERPKDQAANVETVDVSQLLEGDQFEVQKHKFTVERLEVDEDGRMTALTLKDGPKFGVQTIGPERGVIHIDKASLKEVPRPSGEFLPPEEFQLSKPESVAEQRMRLEAEGEQARAREAREKLEREAAAPLKGTSGDLGQGDLLGGATDLFAPPAPKAARSSAIGDPVTPAMPPIPAGTAAGTHAHGRMPVALDRLTPGSIDNPTVMAKLEGVLRAIESQTPIRTGRFNKQAARGIYKPGAKVIRLGESDNIPTAAHELAHAFSDVIFGSAMSAPLLHALRGPAGRPVIRELQALGRALYGNRRPAAGYTAEGLSELTRLWLTTEDAARQAPASAAWFENTLLRAEPEMAAALKVARDAIDIWRGQGAISRAQAQMKDPPGRLARLREVATKLLGKQAQVEEFEPLRLMSEGFRETAGRKLPVAKDPFLLASAKRGSAGAVMETMVDRGMVDVWGNITGPGLREALERVKPDKAGDFALYLWSRRAIERWSKNQNPGMPLEDARYIRTKLESPEFLDASSKWYQWWDGLLEYVKQASPGMNGALVDAIRAGSRDYAPLARVLDPHLVKGQEVGRAGGGLQRMHGSGLPIRNIYQQSLLIAEKLITRAHRDMVLESVFNMSREPGMGHLVEEVPRTRVMESVNIEKIRKQLEDQGVDTSNIGPNELLKFATHLDQPRGTDPIMVRQTPEGPKWYQVPARVFDLLEGLSPARLGPVADFLVAMPNRGFKLGVTGLRASFSLVTNPIRDFPTFLMQSLAGNPASRTAAYFASLKDVVQAGLMGKESPEWKAFKQLGIGSGMFLGGDIQHAKREAKGLFRGRFMRRVTAPVEALRDFLSFTEAVPRLAEMRLVGSELGWRPGQRLTPEQAIAMTVAAKRVTTDFSAAGAQGKYWNQVMPFYNASIQGTRAFLRAFRRDQGIKDEPHRALWTVLKGLSLLTLPALWNWYHNKDEDWYQQLPWRERYLYTNVTGPEGEIVQVPRPPEWGNAFMVLPEMLFDSWYRKDPASALRGFEHMVSMQVPVSLPSTFETARQQLANEISFFNRPIVPRSEIDLPPGEQRTYYTSKLAAALGNAFPNHVSPRRVDAAVRSLFGGVGGDVLDAPGELMRLLGLEEDKSLREPELADVPVAGRLFRRGGEFSGNNRVLAEFWDEYLRTQSSLQAQKRHWRDGTAAVTPLDAQEMGYGSVLRGYHTVIKLQLEIAARTADAEARRKLYQSAAKTAGQALQAKPKGK